MTRDLADLLQHLAGRRRARARARRPRTAPLFMESLEERTLLSVTAHFSWRMQDRFGMDNGTLGPDGTYGTPSPVPDGRIDIWNDPNYVQNKDPKTGQRLGYTVLFDDSPTFNTDPNDPIVSASWVIQAPDGHNVATLSGTSPSSNLAEGTYAVTLHVTTAQGHSSSETQDIRVRDILIVSIGDSAASGEGDPDITDGNGNALWADSPNARQDDRSGRSAAAKAALAIEQADPHTSVTFVDVTVSGAPIAPHDPNDPGIINEVQGKENQLEQVKRIVGDRPIDALTITAGADDIGFKDIVTRLLKTNAGDNGFFTLHLDDLQSIQQDLDDHTHAAGDGWSQNHTSFDQLPAVYDQLDQAIRDKLGNNLTSGNVFITEYFDPTHNSNGQFADGALGDIIPGLRITADAAAFGYNQVEVPLNNAIQAAAARHGWHFVGGISAAFLDHGATAADGDRWVNTDDESRLIEGPVDSGTDAALAGAALGAEFGGPVGAILGLLAGSEVVKRYDRMQTNGTLHPNDKGQQAIADILVQSLQPFLFNQEVSGATPASGSMETALARQPQHLDVFTVGTDGGVYSTWWDAGVNGGQWNPHFRIPGNFVGRPGTPVTVLARSPDHMDLFAVGADGRLYSAWWDANLNNGLWNDWFVVPGNLIAPPGATVTALARTPDHMDLFVVGNDGRVHSDWWDAHANNGLWNDWFVVPGGFTGVPGSPVTAVSRIPEHMDLFAVGNDGHVYTDWWDAGANYSLWSNWSAIPGNLEALPGSTVTVLARSPQHLDAFVAGDDGAVSSAWWDAAVNNAQWNGWFHIPGNLAAPPGATVTALARAPDHMDLFVVGNDTGVSSAWWDAHVNGGQWNSWFAIPGGFSGRPGSVVTALARAPDHMDLFAVGGDGGVYSAWWDANVNNGLWNNWFRTPGALTARPGAPVDALARAPDHMDLFAVDINGGSPAPGGTPTSTTASGTTGSRWTSARCPRPRWA
jgi:hypothetical protein